MNESEPLELFIEEMNSEDIEMRVDAIHKLPIVAAICGPEIVRTKILPLMSDLLNCDEDELLYAIAVELGNIRDFIGGPTHYDKLLQLLEKLANETETVVREESVKSIKLVVENMNPQHIKNSLLPMLNNMCGSQHFPAKISSTFLFEIVYQHINKDEKDNLRAKMIELCNDETPLVKKAMTKNLSTFINVIEKDYILKDIIPIVTALSKDESDQIRCLILESIISISKKVNKRR